MKITSITILKRGLGPDQITLKTDLPPPMPKVDAEPCWMTFCVSKGGGEKYVQENFPGIPIEILEIG